MFKSAVSLLALANLASAQNKPADPLASGEPDWTWYTEGTPEQLKQAIDTGKLEYTMAEIAEDWQSNYYYLLEEAKFAEVGQYYESGDAVCLPPDETSTAQPLTKYSDLCTAPEPFVQCDL